jgi:transcriptional regulator with XRE-family HTH domain
MIPEEELGKRIKRIRLQRKFSLQDLAEKTGFTKGYLSKVENSPKAPPVSTLAMVAKALNVTISEIFGEEEKKNSICLVKKGERPLIARSGSTFGYSYQALAQPYFQKHMEPYILAFPLHPKASPHFQHKGEEFMYVIEGTMKFIYGDKELMVEEGDSIYFDASVPHHGERHGNKKLKCIMVVYTAEP